MTESKNIHKRLFPDSESVCACAFWGDGSHVSDFFSISELEQEANLIKDAAKKIIGSF